MSDELGGFADALAATAMLLVAASFVVPTWFGAQPALSFEVTVVLMLLNIGTLTA